MTYLYCKNCGEPVEDNPIEYYCDNCDKVVEVTDHRITNPNEVQTDELKLINELRTIFKDFAENTKQTEDDLEELDDLMEYTAKFILKHYIPLKVVEREALRCARVSVQGKTYISISDLLKLQGKD